MISVPCCEIQIPKVEERIRFTMFTCIEKKKIQVFSYLKSPKMNEIELDYRAIELWCLMPLSTISVILWRSELLMRKPEKTTALPHNLITCVIQYM
jgi:hypothetical protein